MLVIWEEVQPIITGEGAEVHGITITMFIFDGHGINLIEMMFRCECFRPWGCAFAQDLRMQTPRGQFHLFGEDEDPART